MNTKKLKQNHKVYISHYRPLNGELVRYSRKTKGPIEAKGGYTEVEIDGKRAIARCSYSDTFNYKMGVQIAAGRALSQ